jgi:hypothetical protein
MATTYIYLVEIEEKDLDLLNDTVYGRCDKCGAYVRGGSG